ncbi:uncharacterized protein EAF01_009960 [Botrytis porri]|uniref:uncharacterized protein n=1 Tax=Botrytis porri TaxID=87229 RepID=UPI00190288FA|nr:uncharacterized protein EAF01_009960 [Botrytis porri]KAF7894509.1 hypothetical protein EAF01_009960 [Botrytis porri]
MNDTALASTDNMGEKARSQFTTRQAVVDTAVVTETASLSGSLGQTVMMDILASSQSSSSTIPMYPTDYSDTISDMHWAAEDSSFSGLILPDGTDETFDLSGNSNTGSSTKSYPS